MSDCKMTQWDELYRSLRRERDAKLSYQLGQVNINNLTSHLDELYDKIDKLESRLNELEPSMNDVSGPTGLIGDHPMTNEQYSPATQAVSDAIKAESLLYEPLHPGDVERIAAAALRAAAFAILPLDSPCIEDFSEDDDDSPSDRIGHLKKRIRHKFLAIVAELDKIK